MTERRGPALRDVWLALPVALVLLLVLSSFTLLSYRTGARALRAERQAEALAAARQAAAAVARDGLPPAARLGAVHPGALRMVLADAAGEVVAQSGEPLPGGFAAPLGGTLPGEATATGPGRGTPGAVAAFVPLRDGRRVRFLRVDVASPTLAGQLRTADLLFWVGLSTSAGVLLWILLFLRQLLRPYEALLSLARDLGAGEQDEAAFLLATVQRALAPGEAREELAVLERTLAPNLESGVLLLDRDGRVLALNPAGALLLGPAPPPRTPLADLLAGQPELHALLAGAVAGGQPVQRQETVLRVRGEERRVGLTATPLRRSGGELLGFLVLFTDLTADAREGRDARLGESLAQLGELAAGVAHELRNGLATLAGYVGLLAREPQTPAGEECLQELRLEADHLRRVVADFLSFARPETARLEPLDLAQLARHAAADPALPAGSVTVDAPPPEPPAVLSGDSQLLVRALRNLLRNAIEAHGRGEVAGPVEVRAAWLPGGDRFAIAIADRGPGLPAEVRRRLFQPFASGRPGGVGLGLALAQRIVTLHGGRLELDDRDGGGIVATVSFDSASLGGAFASAG